MSKFLGEATIRHAVDQLGRSSAKGRMCEFLIGVRALRLASVDEVGVAESVPEFIQALEEFTLWASDGEVDSPYFNPFGGHAGFKSRKFRSNGPSNTMHGWATQANSPFEILTNTRPKSIKRRPLASTQLRDFLIQSGGHEDRPRLIDAAVWFYRRTDLEANDGSVPDRAALEDRFVGALGVDNDVISLFRLEDEDTDEDSISGGASEPSETHKTALSSEADKADSGSEPE